MASIDEKEINEIFVHLTKLDSFGKSIIKQNKDMAKLNDLPPPPSPQDNMYALISARTLSAIERDGRALADKYPELRNLSIVMEHPEFYNFYTQYMTDSTRLKQMLVLMKLYNMISIYMKEVDPSEARHNAYHKLVFMQKLLSHPVYSRILFKKKNIKEISVIPKD